VQRRQGLPPLSGGPTHRRLDRAQRRRRRGLHSRVRCHPAAPDVAGASNRRASQCASLGPVVRADEAHWTAEGSRPDANSSGRTVRKVRNAARPASVAACSATATASSTAGHPSGADRNATAAICARGCPRRMQRARPSQPAPATRRTPDLQQAHRSAQAREHGGRLARAIGCQHVQHRPPGVEAVLPRPRRPTKRGRPPDDPERAGARFSRHAARPAPCCIPPTLTSGARRPGPASVRQSTAPPPAASNGQLTRRHALHELVSARPNQGRPRRRLATDHSRGEQLGREGPRRGAVLDRDEPGVRLVAHLGGGRARVHDRKGLARRPPVKPGRVRGQRRHLPAVAGATRAASHLHHVGGRGGRGVRHGVSRAAAQPRSKVNGASKQGPATAVSSLSPPLGYHLLCIQAVVTGPRLGCCDRASSRLCCRVDVAPPSRSPSSVARAALLLSRRSRRTRSPFRPPALRCLPSRATLVLPPAFPPAVALPSPTPSSSSVLPSRRPPSPSSVPSPTPPARCPLAALLLRLPFSPPSSSAFPSRARRPSAARLRIIHVARYDVIGAHFCVCSSRRAAKRTRRPTADRRRRTADSRRRTAETADDRRRRPTDDRRRTTGGGRQTAANDGRRPFLRLLVAQRTQRRRRTATADGRQAAADG